MRAGLVEGGRSADVQASGPVETSTVLKDHGHRSSFFSSVGSFTTFACDELGLLSGRRWRK